MNLIDETKNGKVCKRDLVALSHVDEYPEFEGFIEELCTEACGVRSPSAHRDTSLGLRPAVGTVHVCRR